MSYHTWFEPSEKDKEEQLRRVKKKPKVVDKKTDAESKTMKIKLAMWKCEKCGRVWKQQSSMKRLNSGMMFCVNRYCCGISLLVREGFWKKVKEVMPKCQIQTIR